MSVGEKFVLQNYKMSLVVRKLALPESFRTHKVVTKDQSFYLNYHKFSIKSYVLDVY